MEYTDAEVIDYLYELSLLLDFDGNEKGVAMLIYAAKTLEALHGDAICE